MLEARPDVGAATMRAIAETEIAYPFLVEVDARTLVYDAGVAELAAHVAALRAEPDGGYAVVRALSREQALDFERLRAILARYLSAPRTLLGAVHEVGFELIGLLYVDPADRGFEVLAADAVCDGRTLFRAGDVFVRRAGRTEKWDPSLASRLVERVVERALDRRAAPPPAPAPPAAPPAAPRAAPVDPAALLAEADGVVERYAVGALAVRLGRWDVVREAAAPQGPADTIARARQLVSATPELRPDRADDNKVLDSLCQFDVFAALVAIDAGVTFVAGFARYWAQRSRAALRAVVADPDVRAAVFRGDDDALASALRALDAEAASEGADSGGWPGIGDPLVEEFCARRPG